MFKNLPFFHIFIFLTGSISLLIACSSPESHSDTTPPKETSRSPELKGKTPVGGDKTAVADTCWKTILEGGNAAEGDGKSERLILLQPISDLPGQLLIAARWDLPFQSPKMRKGVAKFLKLAEHDLESEEVAKTGTLNVQWLTGENLTQTDLLTIDFEVHVGQNIMQLANSNYEPVKKTVGVQTLDKRFFGILDRSIQGDYMTFNSLEGPAKLENLDICKARIQSEN